MTLEVLLALLTTATVGVLLIPLLRRTVGTTDRLDNDLAIYRDQLAEIERERAAGTVSASDAEAARTEVERRLLAAAEQDREATTSSPTLHRFLPPLLCILVPLFALGLYLEIGRPGLPSAPFVAGAKPAAPEPAIDLNKLVAEARAKLAAHPDDPDALSALGELLTQQADGVVSEPAVDAFTKALAKNPNDARALFYLGLHEAQSGDSKAALARWRDLEARSAPDAPYLPMLRSNMQQVAKSAGLPEPKSDMPQPSQDQMQAMAKLSPEERQKAIHSMVDGLAAKLATDPGDRSGWLRLANARRVLGENDKAVEAFAKADALGPLDPPELANWAEASVRQLSPGAAPPPATVAVLQRLEKAEPNNALALFYLGAASFASGDKAEAARRWKALLALLPPDAPIRDMLQKQIKAAEGG